MKSDHYQLCLNSSRGSLCSQQFQFSAARAFCLFWWWWFRFTFSLLHNLTVWLHEKLHQTSRRTGGARQMIVDNLGQMFKRYEEGQLDTLLPLNGEKLEWKCWQYKTHINGRRSTNSSQQWQTWQGYDRLDGLSFLQSKCYCINLQVIWYKVLTFMIPLAWWKQGAPVVL